jgi:phenylpyruvate tautomerase PptA (4-oxalocrotonate tautomerase family)
MPNVTIYISADQMPPDEALAELTEQCTELCTGVLQAKLSNVHVIYVAVRHGRGHPVFAEIQYRLEPSRTPPVMDQFMDGLDEAIRRSLGLTARIRCFGHAASSIHARN